MFSYKLRMQPGRKEAIKQLSQIIKELKYTKKEWKKFNPHYALRNDADSGLPFWPASNPAQLIKHHESIINNCHWKLEHLMNQAKIDFIKLCAAYISLLKHSCSILRKYDDNRLQKRQREVYNIMLSMYNDILLSAWKKELAEVHKLEFESDLALKKYIKYIGSLAAQKDIESIKKNDPNLGDILSFMNQNLPSENIERMLGILSRNVASERWKNWRATSKVKTEMQKVSYFANLMKCIIDKYDAIFSNLPS